MTGDDKLAGSLQREYDYNFQEAFSQCIADGCDSVEEAARRATTSADEKLAQTLKELQEGQDG